MASRAMKKPRNTGERGRVSAPREALGALTRPRSPKIPSGRLRDPARRRLFSLINLQQHFFYRFERLPGGQHFIKAIARLLRAVSDAQERLIRILHHVAINVGGTGVSPVLGSGVSLVLIGGTG